MTAEKKENNRLSPTKYLELERASLDIKHEYFNGERFAMVGDRKNHVRINANLTGELRNSFKKNSPRAKCGPTTCG
jgi:Uma2 family endonuclease